MAPYPPAIVLIAAMAWSVWALAHNFRRGWVARKQAEVHLHLLDRLGTGTETLQYLQSPAGRQLLEAVGVERANLLTRIMGSVQAGLILVLLGVALIILRWFVPDGGTLLLAGVPALAIGVGFLASSAFSFHLSRSWA